MTKVVSADECKARFPDDPECADDVALLRRIPKWHVLYDRNRGRVRPSSAAFEDDRDDSPMSVYRRDVIDREGDVPARVMAGREGYGFASFTAGYARSKNQTVCSDPLPDESAHAVVCGPKPKSIRRWLACNADWVVEPPFPES